MSLSENSPVAKPAARGQSRRNGERKRGRPRADTKASIDEARLLRVAFSMFAAHGYEASTMRAMARELDVSHNLLNVRFGRKSDLWKAAVDWRLAEAARIVEQAFTESEKPEDRLRDLIHRFCQWAIINSDIVAISYQEGQQDSWRLEYLLKQFILPFQKRLQQLIADVASKRQLTPIGSGALLALLVHGVGSYFALRPLQEKLLPDQTPVAGSSIDREADIMAEFLLMGLFAGQ
ncbi:TetR/AcrR family transcriptional regulator [Parasphingorhabdus sp.]|uniref:TetR/AcrR family transcriptional regulator n=1 Tax=Parasphingorhabdus sp. TaxID=2709688 RepID=UPI003A9085D0